MDDGGTGKGKVKQTIGILYFVEGLFLRCYLVPLILVERNCFPIWRIVLSLPSSVEMRTLTSHSMQGTNQLSQCLKMLDCLFDMHEPNHQTTLDRKHVASKP